MISEMLPIDVDNCSEEEAFQVGRIHPRLVFDMSVRLVEAVRIHMESKGQFFNYLRPY